MKGLINLILPGIFLFALTGCPYQSKVTLGDPQDSEIDPILLGKWIGIGIEEPGDTVLLLITRSNGNQYVIEYKEKGPTGEVESTRMGAFITMVGDKRIVNVSNSGSSGPYNFYKYEVSGSVLKIAYASDVYTKREFFSSEKLYEYFAANMGNKDFFEPEMTFRKKN